MSPSDKLTVEYLRKSHPGTVPKKVMTHGDKTKPHMTTVYINPNKDTSEPHTKEQYETDGKKYLNIKTQKFATIGEIKQEFAKSGESDLREYIHGHYAISDNGKQTCQVYGVDPITRRYSNARYNLLHKPLIQEKLNQADTPPANVKPVCFLFGGGGASGKSSVINSIVKPLIDKLPYKFAYVDSDEIKTHMPEYEMYQKEDRETAAFRLHRESAVICNDCVKAMIQNKKCFAYDGCMGDYSRYRNLIGYLNKAGYEVHIVAVDVPTMTALERASKRERYVPPKFIISGHDDFSYSFLPITKLKIDSFALYDNSQPPGKPPTCIMDSNGIHDKKLYDRFIKKSEGNEEGWSWDEAQKYMKR